MRELIKKFVRAGSFLGKEIAEVRRQPRLVLSLIFGPFVILFVVCFFVVCRASFALTWRRPLFHRVVVVPAAGFLGTRRLGLSNVSLRHLVQMAATGAEPPAVVQNRCLARSGWDRGVRAFCAERDIVYQGFSLLTANPEVVHHPFVAAIAARATATPAQVVFRFAGAVGMLPLTGTTDAEHMKQDLGSDAIALSADEVRTLEALAG